MADDAIGKSLGLTPLEKGDKNSNRTQIIVQDNGEDNSSLDFEYARGNFYNVIEKGTQALEDMLDVAKASEHPRAYEVVSTIMKTLIDANKDLVSMSNKHTDAQQTPESNNGKTVNNNLFVGSTAELQSMLRDLRNDDTTD